MKNDPFEPSRPTWGEQEVERITTLKEAMNRGTFAKAFEEMFPRQYDNPIEQVMFILGLKHDPQFESPLHSITHGSNPGITNALDQLTAYSAIEANFHAWALKPSRWYWIIAKAKISLLRSRMNCAALS